MFFNIFFAIFNQKGSVFNRLEFNFTKTNNL